MSIDLPVGKDVESIGREDPIAAELRLEAEERTVASWDDASPAP